MALDKQVNIFSVDTGNFYSNHEAHLHDLNRKLRTERNILSQKLSEITEEMKKNKIDDNDLNNLLEQKNQLEELISMKNKKAKNIKNKLSTLLSNKINQNIKTDGKHHIRVLNEQSIKNKNGEIKDKNIISVFDSALTRMIGIKQDEFTDAFMVVQVYYFDVIKDLIYYGFLYKGEKYIYFTSSAGQIRTKKTVFIKESIWNKYEKTIMCGLTINSINQMGGNNPNKHLAYMALTNSATDIWNEFDIDKTIVIDDFETDVYGTYDLVNDEDYSIRRVSDYVPITHTDGAGMMLPTMGKNRMVRLPWIKGLLGVFDFVKFIQVHNCSSVIKDIYGKEHDIIAEDIQIIFTKSQFKMYKYYTSWEQYKEYYKKYNCAAGYTNIEEDRIKNATINYQMLQTLTDVTQENILQIADKSINKLKTLCSSIDNIKSVFGVTPYNLNKTYLQKAIELYPNLINDEYLKIKLREIKNSLVKKYKAGKLEIDGKYTFLLPDFYAACEYWFLNDTNPKGLLYDGEVFCWLFRKNEKLDCLRSPHLFKEHAIRYNVACNSDDRQEQLREWYTTDAIYTSCHDLISKVLQFDVDGDKSLVVSDKNFVEIAEKNMQGIVPLYYNMRKAEPIILNNQSIFNGLNAAFTGGNIGQYSNNISKIWNSDIFISGSLKEKKQAIDLVKLLCMENNFVIDYAKTLYKPIRPKNIHKKITSFTKGNVPAFFIYAKDKNNFQVEKKNNSLVNMLDDIIPNPRINCRNIGIEPIDYTLLMNNVNIQFKIAFNESGRLIEKESEPLIVKYLELSKLYGYKMKNISDTKNDTTDVLSKAKMRKNCLYKNICNEIKFELSQFGYNENEICDILVKYLYGIKENKYKDILWLCYGNYIYENLKKHIKIKTKFIQCVDCGEWFEINIKDNKTCRCNICSLEHKKELKRLKMQRYRAKKIM